LRCRAQQDPVADLVRLVGRYGDTVRRVILNETGDAFGTAQDAQITERLLLKARKMKIHVSLLTKSPALAVRLFPLIASMDAEFGVTITTLDDRLAEYWEPQAARPAQRLEVLRAAHWVGVKTWVSCEPVLDAQTPVRLVTEFGDAIDRLWIGEMNVRPLDGEALAAFRALRLDYADVRRRVEALPKRFRDHTEVLFKEGFGLPVKRELELEVVG